MATRTIDEFLDINDNEEGQTSAYDSEGEDNIKKGSIRTKRRRIEKEDSPNDDEEDQTAEEFLQDEHVQVPETDGIQGEDDQSDEQSGDRFKSGLSPKRVRKARGPSNLPDLSTPMKKNLVSSASEIKASGVIYLSRLPPFMKPSKLRSLLSPYGVLNRLFLTPESTISHAQRVRSGGNKKRSFTDGWIEFVRKADAKRAVQLLNGETIGGKKGSWFRDDIWNLTYLRGFKWRHLTEQMQREDIERQGRLRAEVSRMGREDRVFVRGVERGRVQRGMEGKRQRKKQSDGDAEVLRVAVGARSTAIDDRMVGQKASKERSMHFRQLSAAPPKKLRAQSEDVTRVLSRIF